MKEKLTNNIGLKILSALLAILLWLVVVNIANPEERGYVSVPIEVRNENVILNQNMTYEMANTSVTVSYKVRKTQKGRVSASDFHVYVDLNDMWGPTKSVPVKWELVNNKDLIKSVETNPSVIQIKTEVVQTKRFELQTKVEGTPADGYALGDVNTNPQYISITGPVSEIGKISYAGIEINAEDQGASGDLTGVAKPVLYDANGNALTISDKLTFDYTDITYAVVMLKVKNVSLEFDVGGTVADGYRYTGLETDVHSVSIAGFKSVLASVSSIVIRSDKLDLTGATQDKTVELDLTQFLPASSVTLVGMENPVIQVTLKVEALETKTFEAVAEEGLLLNKNNDYEYTFDEGQKISVTVKGLSEDLDSLDMADLNPQLDVLGLEPGTHDVTASVDVPDVFEVVSISPVSIVITDPNAPSETPAEE